MLCGRPGGRGANAQGSGRREGPRHTDGDARNSTRMDSRAASATLRLHRTSRSASGAGPLRRLGRFRVRDRGNKTTLLGLLRRTMRSRLARTLGHPAREKEKALGPCELRALLRDEPSRPCTRHGRRRITGHCRTLRSDNASYARALDRAHNLSRLRDEIGIASDHFKGG